MINLKIELEQKAYPLYIGVDILPKLSEIYQLYGFRGQAILIADQNLQNSYGDFMAREFTAKNIELVSIYLSDQHIEKGFHSIPNLTHRLLSEGIKPHDNLICMGGRRLLQFTGFLASVLYGGMAPLFVPTTLSAQLITSIDPVNRVSFDSTPELFSTVGLPGLVWSDLAFVKTLPEENFIAGLGYLLQHASLLKNGLFEYLENYIPDITKKDLDRLEEAVQRSCETRNALYKKRASDANFYSRIRFGETTTRAIMEAARPQIRFGEALFFGMLVESVISFKSGIFSGPHFERFYELLKRFPLKYLLNRIDGEKLLHQVESMATSDKVHQLCLPKEIGEFTPDVPIQLSDYEYAIQLIFSD